MFAFSRVQVFWVSRRVACYGFQGLGQSYKYLRKIERAEFITLPHAFFFKCTCCTSNIIQLTLSWNEKLEGSPSKFKGNSRRKENTKQAKCNIKYHKNSVFRYILGVAAAEALSLCYLSGGPTASCFPPTHIYKQLCTSTSPSQCSSDGMINQFNSIKHQKRNIAKNKNKRGGEGGEKEGGWERQRHKKEKNSIFWQVSRLTQLIVWSDEYHSDAKEEKIKQMGAEARGGRTE